MQIHIIFIQKPKILFQKSKILLCENYNWNGDSIEAYAFAYLSVRKLLNLPITFSKTTGVKKPLAGGQIFTFI